MLPVTHRTQIIRRRLKVALERDARCPERFARAVARELGAQPGHEVEALRARVVRGEAWLPALRLARDAQIFGRDVARERHTVVVHEDFARDATRIDALYRASVREALLPARSSWRRRAFGWLQAA